MSLCILISIEEKGEFLLQSRNVPVHPFYFAIKIHHFLQWKLKYNFQINFKCRITLDPLRSHWSGKNINMPIISNVIVVGYIIYPILHQPTQSLHLCWIKDFQLTLNKIVSLIFIWTYIVCFISPIDFDKSYT